MEPKVADCLEKTQRSAIILELKNGPKCSFCHFGVPPSCHGNESIFEFVPNFSFERIANVQPSLLVVYFLFIG